MNNELMELCIKVGSQIKSTPQYLLYQESLRVVKEKYGFDFDSLNLAIEEKPKDYLKIKTLKQRLEDKEEYLVYLVNKRAYEQFLRSTLKEIVNEIDEGIVIREKL